MCPKHWNPKQCGMELRIPRKKSRKEEAWSYSWKASDRPPPPALSFNFFTCKFKSRFCFPTACSAQALPGCPDGTMFAHDFSGSGHAYLGTGAQIKLLFL